MEEKHLEWEANPKKTKQNKIIFKNCMAFSESRKPRPGLGTTYGSGWSKTELMFKNLK